MSNEILVEVNGETRETPAGTNVVGLLEQLGLNTGRVAIEYNFKILPRAQWASTRLALGDRLEIVQFVGGG
jgi:thiamine biosynthesis protein ThiS